MIGHSLSHYEITDELGRGGMGIVYQARDTKLDRTVAIKVLPSAALSSDDDRERFYREAKSAAALNHPNIAQVYQIDEAVPSDAPHGTQPSPFIAMEYISGGTLQDLIQDSPLALSDAVKIASQVAEALNAAHAKDIVHRDIKSANVMITEDGIAKVLDFGLAKTNQSTMLTRMGSTLGTVAYMSPEQARGEEVDGRTDLYSLGTMLYELVAGRLPFSGDYEQAVVYSILNEAPEPLTAVRTGVPMQLEWIVNKLLAKDAGYRYQSANDLLVDLRTVDLSGSGHSTRSMSAMSAAGVTAMPAASAIPRWVYGAIAGALLLGVAFTWALKPDPQVTQLPVLQFSLELVEDVWHRARKSVIISRDGTQVAYLSRSGIHLRRTTDTEPDELLLELNTARDIAFSPDGNWISYYDQDLGQLLKVNVLGGTTRFITSIDRGRIEGRFRGGSGSYWAEDDYIYFGLLGGRLARVSSEGGDVETLWQSETPSAGFGGLHGAYMLPGSRHLLFTLERPGEEPRIADIYRYDLSSGEVERLISGGVSPRYVSSGHLIYSDSGLLYAIRFNPDSGLPTGDRFVVMDQVGAVPNSPFNPDFDVSDNGILVKLSGNGGNTSISRTPHWIDQNGGIIEINTDERNYHSLDLNPDGRQALLMEGDVLPNTLNKILLMNTVLGTIEPVLESASYAVWAPDGVHFVYTDGTGNHLIRTSIEDLSVADTLFSSEEMLDATYWSPDGSYILFNSGLLTQSDVYYLDVDSREAHPFQQSSADYDYAQLSPDGQWIAYESGDQETQLVIQRFPGGEDRFEFAPGAKKVHWSSDGSSVFTIIDRFTLSRISVNPERGTAGVPEPLTSAPVSNLRQFDVHPLEERFLVLIDRNDLVAENEVPATRTLDLVVNWFNSFPQED